MFTKFLYLLMVALLALSFFKDKKKTKMALKKALKSFENILPQFMGEKSGLIGIILAFLLGSAAAGPLYAAFPVAGVLLKKGSKLSNVLIFIGAWSTTKIPMLLFEASALGLKFMLTRFIIDIPGIAIIAYLTEKLMSRSEKELVYQNASKLQ